MVCVIYFGGCGYKVTLGFIRTIHGAHPAGNLQLCKIRPCIFVVPQPTWRAQTYIA